MYRLVTWTMFAVGMLCLACGLLMAVYPWYYLQRHVGAGVTPPSPAQLAAGLSARESPMRLAGMLIAGGLAAFLLAFIFSLLGRRRRRRADARRRTPLA